MTAIELFEGMMLACFSISWWCSIAKMVETKTASPKGLPFVALVALGYVLGIASKVISWWETGDVPLVLWVYGMNMVAVACDALLIAHFTRSPPSALSLSSPEIPPDANCPRVDGAAA